MWYVTEQSSKCLLLSIFWLLFTICTHCLSVPYTFHVYIYAFVLFIHMLSAEHAYNIMYYALHVTLSSCLSLLPLSLTPSILPHEVVIWSDNMGGIQWWQTSIPRNRGTHSPRALDWRYLKMQHALMKYVLYNVSLSLPTN